MEIEEAIYSRLSAYTGLTDLVAARIYPGEKTQDALMPAVNFKSISKLDYPAMSATPSLQKTLFQFDVWASTQESAILVSRQIEKALDRYRTAIGVTIYDAFHRNTVQLGMDGETRQYHVAIDVEFHYDEQ